jgi:hypothetical protein
MAAKEVNFTVVDGENHTSQVGVFVADSESDASILAFIAGFVPLLEAIIEGKVTKATVATTLYSAVASGVLDTSDVEIAAKFIWSVVGSAKKKIMKIPSFNRAKLTAGTSLVNRLDSDVDAFIDYMLATAVLIADPTDSEERDIAGLVSAREEYSRRRRG